MMLPAPIMRGAERRTLNLHVSPKNAKVNGPNQYLKKTLHHTLSIFYRSPEKPRNSRTQILRHAGTGDSAPTLCLPCLVSMSVRRCLWVYSQSLLVMSTSLTGTTSCTVSRCPQVPGQALPGQFLVQQDNGLSAVRVRNDVIKYRYRSVYTVNCPISTHTRNYIYISAVPRLAKCHQDMPRSRAASESSSTYSVGSCRICRWHLVARDSTGENHGEPTTVPLAIQI